MTKLQIALLGLAFALFLAIYVGCETTPEDIRALEKSRALIVESTNLDVLVRDAKAEVPAQTLNDVLALEQRLAEAPDDPVRAEVLKALSSTWFAAGRPAVAGAYAERVAELEGTEQSWSIAGTTFTLCVQKTQDEKTRNYCSTQAVKAYENAISLNPANSAHKVNLALLYVDNPPADNPMKGITMLRDLNRENPEDVLVLNNLGRLAIRTGQYERALERLEQALRLEPSNPTTACLLAQVYEGLGDPQRAGQFSEQCRTLSEKKENANN